MIFDRIDIRTITEDDIRTIAQIMPQRYEKAQKFRFENDRLRAIGAGLLIMRNMEVPDESLLLQGAHGKPYMEGKEHFNLSHSGDFVVFLKDTVPVGIDIEQMSGRNIDIAQKIFTPEEYRWYLAGDPLERFYTLWTRKESVMKATGRGLSLIPQKVDSGVFSDGRIEAEGCRWLLSTEISDGYAVSICRADQNGPGVK